jgi:hypothetical protein
LVFYDYSFEAPVERFGVGRTRKVWYTVIFLPDDFGVAVGDPLPARFRIEGEVNDYPIAGAFIPSGDGRRYIILSPDLLKETGLQMGEMAAMRFAMDDPGRVDIPPELAAALKKDRALQSAWLALTPGRRRGLSHLVRSAKTPATTSRRLSEVRSVVLEFGGDSRQWQQSRRNGKQRSKPGS